MWCAASTRGYRNEADVAKDSDGETFCAPRLFIDSWRWDGVPWYGRSVKFLGAPQTEIIVELKPPPQTLFEDAGPREGPGNYLRFRRPRMPTSHSLCA